MGVNLNGEESSFFKHANDLRQGIPFIHFFFNLVVDVLTRMLQKGAERGIIRGVAENSREGVLSLLLQMTPYCSLG